VSAGGVCAVESTRLERLIKIAKDLQPLPPVLLLHIVFLALVIIARQLTTEPLVFMLSFSYGL
jgi:hypothetical protein